MDRNNMNSIIHYKYLSPWLKEINKERGTRKETGRSVRNLLQSLEQVSQEYSQLVRMHNQRICKKKSNVE